MRDICEYLGGRADKDFLGTGNTGLVIQKIQTRLLFVQRWREGGLLDWAAGEIRSWAPDRVEMDEAVPPVSARISVPPSARWVFAAAHDIFVAAELVPTVSHPTAYPRPGRHATLINRPSQRANTRVFQWDWTPFAT